MMARGLAACVLSKVLLERVLSVDAFALQWNHCRLSGITETETIRQGPKYLLSGPL